MQRRMHFKRSDQRVRIIHGWTHISSVLFLLKICLSYSDIFAFVSIFIRFLRVFSHACIFSMELIEANILNDQTKIKLTNKQTCKWCFSNICTLRIFYTDFVQRKCESTEEVSLCQWMVEFSNIIKTLPSPLNTFRNNSSSI